MNIAAVAGVKPTRNKKPAVRPVIPATPGAPTVPAPVVPNFTGDSTYFSQLAQNTLNRDTSITDLTDQQNADTADTQRYQKMLAGRSLDSQSGSMANAAKMGLSNSGYNAKNVADIIKDTTQQQLTADAAWRQRSNARNNQVNALTFQYGQGTDYGAAGTQAYAEGEGRMLQNYTPPGAAKTGNANFPLLNSKTGQAYREQTIAGKKVHVYPDGRKVVVG